MSQINLAEADPVVTCSDCQACCCQLEVMLIGDADVPEQFTGQNPWGGWVMRRLDDGWCAALDRQTKLCTIYEQRPDICRAYEMGDSDCIEQRTVFFARANQV